MTDLRWYQKLLFVLVLLVVGAALMTAPYGPTP
jgi:hypothetical protein